MTRFNLSLNHKRWKELDEQDPRKKRNVGRPKKCKLRGVAAKYYAQQSSIQSNLIVPDDVHRTIPRKRSSNTTSRRTTRSNAPRRSQRARAPVEVFRPFQEITSASHQRLSSHTRKQSLTQRIQNYRTKLHAVKAHCDRLRSLYYRSSIMDECSHINNSTERFESSIAVTPQKPRGVTSNDIRQLVKNCRRQKPQLITNEVLALLGMDGRGKLTDSAKVDKLNVGIQTLFKYLFPTKKENVKAHILGKLLHDGDIFSKEASREVVSILSRSFTRSIFTPSRILETIDTKCQGSLNDSGVRDYANIEKEVTDVPFKRGTSLLPDRNGIGKCRKLLNTIIDPIVGLEHNKNPTKFQHGDHVQNNYEKMTRFLIEGFGLTEKAVTSGVELCFTADGATIAGAKCASQTAAGIKVMDIDSIDPDDGEKMFINETNDDGEVVSLKNYQCYRNHALTEILLHSETKEIIRDVFADFFRFGIDFGDNGLKESVHGPALMAGGSAACGDMSLLHKITGRGGACKVMYFFCMCCEAHGEEDMFVHFTGDERCSICKQNGRILCRHRQLNDMDEIRRKTDELFDELTRDFKRRLGDETSLADLLPDELKDTVSPTGEVTLPISVYCSHIVHSEEESHVVQHSKMFFCPELLDKKDTSNIDCNLAQFSPVVQNEFNTHVVNDLLLRGYCEDDLMVNFGSDERRNLLRNCLNIGRRIRMIRHALTIEEKASLTQIVPVARAIPCILHAKNRTAEKFLEQLLLHGLRSIGRKKDRIEFIQRVQETINGKVLGKTEFNDLGQWRIPMENDKLGDIKLSCPDANKIVDSIDVIVEVCTAHLPVSRQEEWLACSMYYAMSMELLKSRKVFNFDDVCEFQGVADEFGDLYVHLTGIDGMTNYFHFLIAGHFSYYLIKYGNLYKYSQQGWERVNGKAKRSYHHNTQKGGGKGGSSKLLPIVRMFNRELFWRFKHGQKFFKQKDEQAVKYGKVLKEYFASEEEIQSIASTILNMGSTEDIYGNDNDVYEAAI